MNTQDSVPTSSSSLLATLRHLGREPADSMEGMRRVAAAQAHTLRQALPSSLHEIPAGVSALIPSIVVEYIDHLPAAGISYWANHRWHIHVHKEDPTEVQALTVLHQLKRIIDHPLRQKDDSLSEPEWNFLADYFAHRVLKPEPRPALNVRERRNAYERTL